MSLNNYSKEIQSFVSHLVSNYAKYDDDAEGSYLTTDQLADSKLFEFACMLMTDEMTASEATGVDNPNYNKTMWPSLLHVLKNPGDPEAHYDFTNDWRKGIVKYLEKIMQKLIDEVIYRG